MSRNGPEEGRFEEMQANEQTGFVQFFFVIFSFLLENKKWEREIINILEKEWAGIEEICATLYVVVSVLAIKEQRRFKTCKRRSKLSYLWKILQNRITFWNEGLLRRLNQSSKKTQQRLKSKRIFKLIIMDKESWSEKDTDFGQNQGEQWNPGGRSHARQRTRI